jgi:hypothetical protein
MRDDADWRDEPEPYVPFEKAGEHTARKRHTCDFCHNDIEPGTRYFRHTALVDGELVDDKWHLGGACDPNLPMDVEIRRQP